MAKEAMQIKDLGEKFVQIPHHIMVNHAARIGFAAVCVYVAMKMFADSANGECYPSQERIAEIIGGTRKTVRVAIEELIDAGLVKKGPRQQYKQTYFIVSSADLRKKTTTPAEMSPIIYEPDAEEAIEPEDAPEAAEQNVKLDSKIFFSLKTYIQSAYMAKVERPCPWSRPCDAQLWNALRRLGGWTSKELRDAVDNFFSSDESHSQSPHKWLAKLESYASGALNQFGKPKESISSENYAQKKQREAFDNIARAAGKL